MNLNYSLELFCFGALRSSWAVIGQLQKKNRRTETETLAAGLAQPFCLAMLPNVARVLGID